MAKPIIIFKAGGVILKDRRFLVAREYGQDVFVAPGGKPEAGESITEALIRELYEEVLLEITEANIEPFGEFEAIAAGDANKIVKMSVFIVNDFKTEPVPSAEIEELMWINSKTTGIKVGSIFEHEVLPKLKAMDLID